MALLTVLTAPDPRLKKKALPVEEVDDSIRKLLDDMLETMYANDGIGLAAIQVGVEKRCVVMDHHDGPDNSPNPYKMVNPEVIWASEDSKDIEEGCLSVPYQYAKVRRPASAKVQYLDETGQERVMVVSGVMAACIQHEIDHLNGILFVDHLSSLKRNMVMRRLMKERRIREKV